MKPQNSMLKNCSNYTVCTLESCVRGHRKTFHFESSVCFILRTIPLPVFQTVANKTIRFESIV